MFVEPSGAGYRAVPVRHNLPGDAAWNLEAGRGSAKPWVG